MDKSSGSHLVHLRRTKKSSSFLSLSKKNSPLLNGDQPFILYLLHDQAPAGVIIGQRSEAFARLISNSTTCQ
jgi:hypothetical protein